MNKGKKEGMKEGKEGGGRERGWEEDNEGGRMKKRKKTEMEKNFGGIYGSMDGLVDKQIQE